MTLEPILEMDDLLRELSSEVGQLYRWVAEQAGLNQTDLFALYFIRSSDGAATPKQLSEHLGLTSGATAILLNRLEAREMIMRARHPTDRRGVLLSLGPGATKHEFLNLRQRLRSLNADFMAELSPEEADVVRRFMSQMLSNTRDALRQLRIHGFVKGVADDDAKQ